MAEFLSSDPAVQEAHPHTTYDLLANICHDGPAGECMVCHVTCAVMRSPSHRGW